MSDLDRDEYDLPYYDFGPEITDLKDATRQIEAVERRLTEVEGLIDRERWDAASEAIDLLAEDFRLLRLRVDSSGWHYVEQRRWNERALTLKGWIEEVGGRLDWHAYFARGVS